MRLDDVVELIGLVDVDLDLAGADHLRQPPAGLFEIDAAGDIATEGGPGVIERAALGQKARD